MDPQYIGDGVYISIDGSGQVVLTTGSHDPAKADNTIYLEPEVLRNFEAYLQRAGIRP